MFDFVSPEFRPFIGVALLAVLFLAVASLIQKYRVWQAEKMRKAQGLVRGAAQLRSALVQLEGLPLPREVAELCREEQLLRYQAVRALFPKYQGLDEQAADAERIGPVTSGEQAWVPPQLDSSARYEVYVKSLSGILAFLSNERCLGGADPTAARALRVKLRTLRAEAQYAHYRRIALEAAQVGDWNQAVKHVLALLSLLKEKAAPNDRCKTLYHMALELYRSLAHHELPSEEEGGAGANAA